MTTLDTTRSRQVVRKRAGETARVTRLATTRVDSLLVAIVSGVLYLLGYLWATDHLTIDLGSGFSLFVVDEPVVRMFEQRGPATYEPIAVADIGFGTLLFSPIDTGIGVFLAALVGLNLALAYLALVQPKSCGIGAGAGFAASVPALLSGSVCCAPMVLLVLGIQASGALLTVLPWLLPLGVLMLVASVVYVAGFVDASGVSAS